MEHQTKSASCPLAIVAANALEAMGMKSLLEKIVPFAEVEVFATSSQFFAQDVSGYFHCFVSAENYAEAAEKFQQLGRHLIVFGKTPPTCMEGGGQIFVATHEDLEAFTKAMVHVQQSAHHQFERYPARLSEQLRREDAHQTAALTRRETEVLRHIAEGRSSKEIAARLHISMETVASHRKHIMEKLHAHTATQVLVYAANHGLIKI